MLRIDVHEPAEMASMLASSVPCEVVPLNSEGFADYWWEGIPVVRKSNRHQVERKTWNELLGNLDSVEDQLRREREAHPDISLKLLVEGLATPSRTGTQVWKLSGNRPIWHTHKDYRLPITAVYSWLYQVGKYMEVYFTADLVTTAKALVAFYKADQKENHVTFHRYLKIIDFHPNPQVEGLMNVMKGTSIGAVRAQALIDRFGTIWHVLSADLKEIAQVEGMGSRTAQQLLRKVGRLDV